MESTVKTYDTYIVCMCKKCHIVREASDPSHLTLLETRIFKPEAGLVLILKKASNMTPVTFDSFRDTYLQALITTEEQVVGMYDGR